MAVYMKKHMTIVTAKSVVNQIPTVFFLVNRCIIQDDIKRSIFHHHVNGN